MVAAQPQRLGDSRETRPHRHRTLRVLNFCRKGSHLNYSHMGANSDSLFSIRLKLCELVFVHVFMLLTENDWETFAIFLLSESPPPPPGLDRRTLG